MTDRAPSDSSSVSPDRNPDREAAPATGWEAIEKIAEFRGGQIPLVSGNADAAVRKILSAAECLKDHAYDIGFCDAKGDATNKAVGRALQAGEDLGRIRAGVRELIIALRRDS